MIWRLTPKNFRKELDADDSAGADSQGYCSALKQELRRDRFRRTSSKIEFISLLAAELAGKQTLTKSFYTGQATRID
jgi:hypothetical protein